jgi:hypothetical protein
MRSAALTGLDEALKLETIYYSAPVPRNLSVLTVLVLVFDKIYFPGVYLPMEGFDQVELDKEIARIEALPGRDSDDSVLLGVLRFVRHVRTLKDVCIFTGDRMNAIAASDAISQSMVKDIYEAIHGPSPSGWTPLFSTACHKTIPGSGEHVTYPGDYHYLAGALIESAKRGIPLLSDIPGLPVPGLEEAAVKSDARTLSAILSIECLKLALPEIPLLRPEDLIEFRAENVEALRAFRRSMLRYAADLNGKLRSVAPDEVQAATQFFVQTELVPALDELRATMEGPARPWHKRAIDLFRVVPVLAGAFMTMNEHAAIAKVLTTYAGQFFTEIMAKGDQRETLKRSGLYYLLRLRSYQANH